MNNPWKSLLKGMLAAPVIWLFMVAFLLLLGG